MKILIIIGMLIGCSNKVMKLKDKPLTSEQQAELNTQLIEASENGKTEAITELIKAGADVNHARENGVTALIEAAYKGHAAAIRALIEGGADVNYYDSEGSTALIFAALGGNYKARSLLGGRANVNRNQKNGHVEAIRVLIAAGANVNHVNEYGWTALICAAKYVDVEAIRALIQAGADVNYAIPNGYTALIFAAENGHDEAITALIQAGADVNRAEYIEGNTALMLVLQGNHVEAIKALIAAGADVNMSHPEHRDTSLMLAARKGHLISFMKAYAKIKFNLPNDVPEHVLVNSAFILLLQLLDKDICIYRITNICAIRQEDIDEFLSDPLIDLSALVTHNVPNVECEIENKETQNKEIIIQDVSLRMNAIEIIYKNLLPDVFDAIYNSEQKEQMLDIIKGWDVPTKRKMLMYIFNKRNANKLKAILNNTRARDPKANEKREALKEMVRPLLVDGVYISQFKELQILKELIYKIFEDKIHPDNLDENIIIDLHNKGWR